MNMNHAILQISTGSGYWRMQVMQPDMPRKNRWMSGIYIDSDAVRLYLRDKARYEMALNASDDMVVTFRKIFDGQIRISIYDLCASLFAPNTIDGRYAILNVPEEKLLAVPDKSHAECKILCETGKRQHLCQSRITFDEYAHRNIRMMDKHERRAFSKFICNAFRYGSESHVCISGYRHGGEFKVYEDGDLCGWIDPYHYEHHGHASVRYKIIT